MAVAAWLVATGEVAAGAIPCAAGKEGIDIGGDVAHGLTAFILFCLGVQIVWTGASELLGTIS